MVEKTSRNREEQQLDLKSKWQIIQMMLQH